MIPDHLVSTHRMLLAAYPKGLPDTDYVAVLSLLYPHMSDRCLAEVIALTFGKGYFEVYNDTAKCVTISIPATDTVEQVRLRLQQVGYDDWLREEDK